MAYDPEKEVAVMFAYKGQVRLSGWVWAAFCVGWC